MGPSGPAPSSRPHWAGLHWPLLARQPPPLPVFTAVRCWWLPPSPSVYSLVRLAGCCLRYPAGPLGCLPCAAQDGQPRTDPVRHSHWARPASRQATHTSQQELLYQLSQGTGTLAPLPKPLLHLSIPQAGASVSPRAVVALAGPGSWWSDSTQSCMPGPLSLSLPTTTDSHTSQWTHPQTHLHIHTIYINSLAPVRSGYDSKNGINNLVLLIGIFRSSHDNALQWMPLDLIDDKSTLVQVMAWCQCCPDLCHHMASIGHIELLIAPHRSNTKSMG